MNSEEFKERTRQLALGIIHLTEMLPSTSTARVLGRQLLRSGTSVGSNYRSACRARSKADFIAKMGIVEEEADETLYWLDLLVASNVVGEESAAMLKRETEEIPAMTVASIRTSRQRKV